MARPSAVVRVVALTVSLAYSLVLLAVGLELPGWARTLVSLFPTLAVGALVVWDLWLWRLPFVQPLVRRPDLRGLWQVELTPHPDSHIPAEGNSGPVAAFLEVTQTYWSVYTRLYTAESSSRSTATTWLPTFESTVDNLTYAYENEPRVAVSHRSARSTGSCTLKPASMKPIEMEGTYFTDRLAKGDMTLAWIDHSRGHANFASALRHAEQTGRRGSRNGDAT